MTKRGPYLNDKRRSVLVRVRLNENERRLIQDLLTPDALR